MDSDLKRAILILIVFFLAATTIAGFFAARSEAEAISDNNCKNWPPESGPHDEIENPHGCHKVCVDGHLWYRLGKTSWCYYDDREA